MTVQKEKTTVLSMIVYMTFLSSDCREAICVSIVGEMAGKAKLIGEKPFLINVTFFFKLYCYFIVSV